MIGLVASNRNHVDLQQGILRELERRGQGAVVLSLDPWYAQGATDRGFALGLPVDELPLAAGVPGAFAALPERARLAAAAAARDLVRHWLAERRPEAVLLCNDTGIVEQAVVLEARALGVRTLLLQEGDWSAVNAGRRHPGRIMLGEGGCDAILAWGDRGRSYFEALGAPAPVTPCGLTRIDPEPLSPDDLRATFGFAEEAPIVLLATQCFARYGLMTAEEERRVYSGALEAVLADPAAAVLVAPHPSHEPGERAWLRSLCEEHPRALVAERVGTELLLPSVDAVVGVCTATFSDAVRHGVPCVSLPYAWGLYNLGEDVPVLPAGSRDELAELFGGGAWRGRLEEHAAPRRSAYLERTFADVGEAACARAADLLPAPAREPDGAPPVVTVIAPVDDAGRDAVETIGRDARAQRGVEVDLVLLDRTHAGDLADETPEKVVRSGFPSLGAQVRAAAPVALGDVVTWMEPGTRSSPYRLLRSLEHLQEHAEADALTCDLLLSEGPGLALERSANAEGDPAPGPSRLATLTLRRRALGEIPNVAFVPAVEHLFARLCRDGRTTTLYMPLVTLPRSRLVEGRPPPPLPARPSGEPDLTVLVCTMKRRPVLFRCLESFCRQTAPPGSYEIVVVEDGATPAEKAAVEGLELPVPLTWIDGPARGLAAARNAGIARSRGRILLLVNDDTIAFPELVAEHLAAHRRLAPRRMAVLGTFEQPEEALGNALMRCLEGSTHVFAYSAMTPGEIYDWNHFWTCNVSVPAEAVRAAGGFDESFRAYGAEDTELGYRLYEQGYEVYYEGRARSRHLHVLDFDELARRQVTVARAWTRLFEKHPLALRHPCWKWVAPLSRRACLDAIGARLAELPVWESAARGLAEVDLGAFERAGPGHERLARDVVERLGEVLEPLDRLWWQMGFAEALEERGIDGFAQLIEEVPWTIAGARGRILLLVPDWTLRAAWEPALARALCEHGAGDDVTIVVIADEDRGFGAERVAREIVGLATRVRADDDLPRVVVEGGRLDATDLARLLRTADALLPCPGGHSAALRGLARAAGTTLADLPRTGDEPLPVGTDAPFRVLAWPDFTDANELWDLLGDVGRALHGRADWCLHLRHDADVDGDYAAVEARVRRAVSDARTAGVHLNVMLVSDRLKEEELRRLGRAANAAVALPSSAGGPRAGLLAAAGVPVVRGRAGLAELVASVGARAARLAWRLFAQPGEMAFHRDSSFRRGPGFMSNTTTLFEHWGYTTADFAGRIVVDVGAGSRLRSKFFRHARIVAIEPLADQMRSEIPWCDLDDAEAVHACPAEERIPSLDGQAAFVMCLNVLDHTFDPAAIVRNAAAYLAPDGELLLSLDLHDHADDLHPVHLDRDGVVALCEEAGLEPSREFQGLPGSPAYGHGEALTLVLRRAAVDVPLDGDASRPEPASRER